MKGVRDLQRPCECYGITQGVIWLDVFITKICFMQKMRCIYTCIFFKLSHHWPKLKMLCQRFTQQLENSLSCMNVDYITDYSRVHGQNLALSHGHHGVMRDRDRLSSPPTNQRFGTV